MPNAHTPAALRRMNGRAGQSQANFRRHLPSQRAGGRFGARQRRRTDAYVHGRRRTRNSAAAAQSTAQPRRRHRWYPSDVVGPAWPQPTESAQHAAPRLPHRCAAHACHARTRTTGRALRSHPASTRAALRDSTAQHCTGSARRHRRRRGHKLCHSTGHHSPGALRLALTVRSHALKNAIAPRGFG